MGLATKFNLILIPVLALGFYVLSTLTHTTLQENAKVDIVTRAGLMMDSAGAVRAYTVEEIKPLLVTQLRHKFLPQSVPAYAATQAFMRLQKHNPDYSYKEATLNPTNPLDQADEFEAAIVERMRSDPALKEVSGFRTLPDGRAYYVAKPIKIAAESCLSCHSTPEAAPKSMLAVYTSGGGFGWQLNEIIGTQIIYVPAEEVLNRGLQSFLVISAIFVATLVAAILLINFTLNRLVIQPVTVMGGLAQKISMDQLLPGDLESGTLVKITTSGDELGYLARVFRQMAREVRERTQRLQATVQQLHIEIDEIKRKKQVEEIVDSTFFGNVQAKARVLREQRQRTADESAKDDSAKDAPPQDDSVAE